MAVLQIKPKSECKYDILALGEVMIRLDPGDNRIHTTRMFRAWEGGGEYNVARALRRCFGKQAAVLTAIVDNPVGRLLEDLMEWEEEEEEELRRNIDQAKLKKTLSRLLSEEAAVIRDTLIHQPWSGRIISADGEDLIISGGADTGLKDGKILNVYEKGEGIRSVNGKSIYLLGSKIGEIKILTVRESDSSAVPLTEGSYRAGQVIRLKR